MRPVLLAALVAVALALTACTHAADVVGKVRAACGDASAQRFLAVYKDTEGGVYLQERSDEWAAQCAPGGKR